MATLSKFDKECGLVQHLTNVLALPATFTDPHAGNAPECGFDVVAQIGIFKAGVQVTTPGDRAEEAKRAREANTTNNGVYFMWANADAGAAYRLFANAIKTKIAKAEAYDFTPYNETWLLMVAGVPETPGAVSTLLPPWFDTVELSAATEDALKTSKFDRVYIHSVLDVEQRIWVWTRHDRKWIQQI